MMISLSGIQIGESASCGKIQTHPRPLVNNGSGPFHCPSTLPMALDFVALDTNGEALQLFWTNEHLNYLLRREYVARFDGEKYT